MSRLSLFNNILNMLHSNTLYSIENNELILHEFIHTSNCYSTLSSLVVHQHLSKYYKEYHQQFLKVILNDDFDVSNFNINIIVLLKNIYVDSCGISCQNDQNQFINIIVKFGNQLIYILFEKETLNTKDHILCFQLLELLDHICDGDLSSVILDVRFFKILSEIFSRLSISKSILNYKRYNIHMLMKLLKKSHDILNFHDESLYSKVLITLLFGRSDINNHFPSIFIRSLSVKYEQSLCDYDESRKWLSLLQKLILLFLDWISSLSQDINNTVVVDVVNTLFSLSKIVDSLNKNLITLFIHDDEKLMKLLSYCLVIEKEMKEQQGQWTIFELMKQLLKCLCYDVELICQWLRDYEYFKDVFLHFLKILRSEKVKLAEENWEVGIIFLEKTKVRFRDFCDLDDIDTALKEFIEYYRGRC